MSEHEIGESAYDWGESDEVESAQRKNAEAQIERAKAYSHVFGHDPLGQRILAEWINMYCTGGIPGHSASARECAMRDGKQELIAMIVTQLQIASGENYEASSNE